MTTSAIGNDFRTWNAAFAQECNAPWYPSEDLFPTTDDYRPNCTWIGTDDRFPHSISMKLTDFSFPGSNTPRAVAIADEIKSNRDYLCNAPGRMMFWKKGDANGEDHDECIPIYPPIKRYDNGTAIDPKQILQGHVFGKNCDPSHIGTPWFNYPHLKDPFAPQGGLIPPLRGVPAKRAQPTLRAAVDPAIARRWGGERSETAIERRRILLERRDLCVENLVISPHPGHSARSVCESDTSYGPDFVSLHDGMYCDMCERSLHPVCRPSIREGCFDLVKKELRLGLSGLQGRKLQDMPPPKTYKSVARWETKSGK
ncbi:hypothetical protein GQ53DRAFT_4455 [Thozetella sp. PMI_491]|nr:hypothetical protein GQ53DRAFT_4455 [Thozetella sp. PMI_491]